MKSSPHLGQLQQSVVDFVWATVTTSTASIQLCSQAVLIRDDKEALHDFRVEVRKLRSDLLSFRTIIDRNWVDVARKKLKWLVQFTTPIRDGDVLLERLEKDFQKLDLNLDPNLVAIIRGQLIAETSKARDQFYEALASDHCATLMTELSSWGEGSAQILAPHKELKKILQILNSSSWQGVRQAVKAQKSEPSDDQMHRLRIMVKRARYLAQASIPILGKPAERKGRDLELLQGILGEHQDSAVMSRWLSGLNGLERSILAQSQTVQILLELEAGRRFQLRRQYREVWALSKKSHGITRYRKAELVRGWRG